MGYSHTLVTFLSATLITACAPYQTQAYQKHTAEVNLVNQYDVAIKDCYSKAEMQTKPPLTDIVAIPGTANYYTLINSANKITDKQAKSMMQYWKEIDACANRYTDGLNSHVGLPMLAQIEQQRASAHRNNRARLLKREITIGQFNHVTLKIDATIKSARVEYSREHLREAQQSHDRQVEARRARLDGIENALRKFGETTAPTVRHQPSKLINCQQNGRNIDCITY